MLDNKVLMSGNKMALYIPPPPIVPKGSIVNLDLDGNGNKQYRVLKCNGNVAQVMAMYNDLTSEYSNTSLKDMFGSTIAQSYKNSTLDTYLNTTWYNTLKDNVKANIIPEDIVQYCYMYYDEPNTVNPPTYTYQYEDNWTGNYNNADDVGNITIGKRNIFALDLKDIYDFFGKAYITSNELNTLFFDQITTISHSLWLRSACAIGNRTVWRIVGENGVLAFTTYDESNVIRPALNLDLSKISFTLAAKTETWVIKDTAPVDTASRELAAQPCSFTSNGRSFSSISVTDPAATAVYVLSYGGLDVAGMDTGTASAFEWDNDAYKTLVFDTPPTGNLLTWLQANATKQ